MTLNDIYKMWKHKQIIDGFETYSAHSGSSISLGSYKAVGKGSFTGITSDGEIHQAPLDKVRGNDYTLMFIEESARLEEGE